MLFSTWLHFAVHCSA